MFSYTIDKIGINTGIHHIISIYIKYNNTKIKITPMTYNIPISNQNVIEIETMNCSIICVSNLLFMEFHNGYDDGFNICIEIKITENDFDNFKNIIQEINEKVKE